MHILLIDNYDSFTYNLYDLIYRTSGLKAHIIRNDELSFEEIVASQPDCVVLSSGPGHPSNKEDFGVSSEILMRLHKPILGICLGHQGIAEAFGGSVIRADLPVHGLTDFISHDGRELFQGIPQRIKMVRYHSLIVDYLPPHLKKIAWNDAGLVMGVRHISRMIFGVQFHPESVCSEFGETLMNNFLRIARSAI